MDKSNWLALVASALFIGLAVGWQIAANTTEDRVNAAANRKIAQWEERVRYWEAKYRREHEAVKPGRRIGSPLGEVAP